jgi:putative peptide zinc metalloprotease protein
VLAAAAVVAGLAWAWWPSGQYQPVRASERGTLPSLVQMLGSPKTVVRSASSPSAGTVLALAAIPQGGVSAENPALFLIPGHDGDRATAVAVGGSGKSAVGATFPFTLPAKPGPGDTQALAVGSKDGGVVYDISYALVTIEDGAPVTNTNSAFAFASCKGCTTVAVSFQIVLVVGQSDTIAPINAAGALNVDCPACMTTAIADQIVVTVSQQPSAELQQKLKAALAKLNALPSLGADATPAEIYAQVQSVQQQVVSTLNDSGIVTGGSVGGTTSSSTDSASSPAATSESAGSSTASPTTAAAEPTSSGAATSSASSTATSESTSAPASSTAGASPTS